jgi:diguanylate cyclase (GGDEF)-like protein
VHVTTERRETSAATTGLLVRFVERRAGPEGVAALLARAGVPHSAEELCSESRWFSYEDRIRLFEAMVEVLDDPDAPFDLGASAARNGLNPSLVLLLRGLGSPRQVFKQLPRAVAKFSTTSTMEMLDAGETHALVRYRLHDGFEHSRHDCRYAQGLVSAVPTVFGLPPARVLHEECESDGEPACLYHVTWDRRARTPWGRRREDRPERAELEALRGQLQTLQFAASNLAASDDLEAALENVITQAGAAVVAPAHIGVVLPPDGGAPVVHSAGLDDGRLEHLAAELLAGRDLGPNAVVVDISTARRHHGRLAALYPDGTRSLAGERAMLLAYAGHAAAVLDQLTALEASRRGESRARALLDLAHDLAAANDDLTVARRVADALPDIVGSVRSSVMRWDAAAGELRAVATAGLSAEEEEHVLGRALQTDEVPELIEMHVRREPITLERHTASPHLAALLEAIGAQRVTAVPLVGADELLGVATVGWPAGQTPDGPEDEIIERLLGVAEQAAAALENARLLAAVRHQSLHDPLTGLPNRVLFSRHLDAVLSRHRPDRDIAVLFCDLDRFKATNDELGHAAGDELLRQVAARLRTVVRAEDLVGRLSGDEFALILEVADVEEAATVAARVVDCFERPFRLEGREVRVTISVGVAVDTPAGSDADRMLRAADGAMYEAKQRGRNQVVTAVDTSQLPIGTPLHQELRVAIDEDQLRLRFQPVVALGSDRDGGTTLRRHAGSADRELSIIGSEALVHWEHPRLGLLAPSTFLPIAQERGMGADLDLWVLREAVRRHAALDPDARAEHQLAINLSAATLLDERLLPAVREARSHHGLASGQLVLEVVESRTLVDLPGVAERLVDLRRMGVRIALDDFGTGYSTLWWLLQLPIDQIKIDRSFVAPLPGDCAAAALVRGVLAMARELDVEVVAEGVETVAQLEALASVGCDRLQGYLFGRPADDIVMPGPIVPRTSVA